MLFDKRDMDNVNRIYTDFRSDVVAAGLVEHGFDIDKILILRRQGDPQDKGKEIKSIEYKKDYEREGENVLTIKTSRRGIYDSLPEGLFHSTAAGKTKSKESIIAGMRRQQEEEFFVRRFFSLFETEAERTRIDIQLIELYYDRPGEHRTFVDTMLPFWPIIKLMEPQTAILFMRMVPYIPEIRNSFGNIAEALSIITGHSVNIELEYRPKKTEIELPRLGHMRLGINSILKGSVYETIPDAVVFIEPQKDKIDELLPGNRKRQIVENILKIFMPANISFEIIIKPEAEKYSCRLGDRKNPCYLGVNAKFRQKENES